MKLTANFPGRVAEPISEPCNGPEQLALACQDIADLDREVFVVLGLDSAGCIVGKHLVSVGTLTASLVHPREVFRPLIASGGVRSFVCVHNHPSGRPTPSAQDRELHNRLRECGELLGIKMHDWLILGKTQVYSDDMAYFYTYRSKPRRKRRTIMVTVD